MDVHILLLSTMTPKVTAQNLAMFDLHFDETAATVQKLQLKRPGPVSVSLWVACHHPLVSELASSFAPHMDACVCWYHDHNALSCLRVASAMSTLKLFRPTLWMMVTTHPVVHEKHQSRIKKYFDEHGFERVRLIQTLDKNIEKILARHLEYHKTL